MSGIGSIDASFRPATRFDSWLDTRCEPYVAGMASLAARITTLSGRPPTYSHAPKMAWWLHERPEDFARIARFVVPGAFVAARICGLTVEDAFIDRTYLHFSNLADTAASAWSPGGRGARTPGVLPRRGPGRHRGPGHARCRDPDRLAGGHAGGRRGRRPGGSGAGGRRDRPGSGARFRPGQRASSRCARTRSSPTPRP